MMWTMTLYLKAKSFHTALTQTQGYGFQKTVFLLKQGDGI